MVEEDEDEDEEEDCLLLWTGLSGGSAYLGGVGGWVKIHGGSGEDLDDLFEGERVVADETEGLGGEIRASGLAETGDGDDVAW